MDQFSQDLAALLGEHPEWDGLEDIEAAGALNAAPGAPALAERMVNERTIFDALGPQEGEAFMTALEGAVAAYPFLRRPVAWMAPDKQGVDASRPATRAMLDQLAAAGAISPAHAAAVKALAEVPRSLAEERLGRSVTHFDIARARGRGGE